MILCYLWGGGGGGGGGGGVALFDVIVLIPRSDCHV